jgi:hypothetical protein
MASSVRFSIAQQFSMLSARLSEGRDDRSPLAPDAVLPEQFFDPHSGIHSGIRALMQAILEDAFACFHKQFVANTRRARRLGKEAEEWLFSDDICWPFSFVNICHALGLEPGHIRRRLRQQQQRSLPSARRKSSHIVFPRRSLKVAA